MINPYLFPLRFRSNPGSEGIDKGERLSKINQDRDAWALHKIVSVVKRPGVPEEDLFNVPCVDLAQEAITPQMRSGDLLVVATRGPAHDYFDDAKKKVASGYNWLEEQILIGLDGFFQWCSRKHVLLTAAGASCLAQDYSNRASVRFQVTDDAARYKQRCGLKDPPMPPRTEITRLVEGLGPKEREGRLDVFRRIHLDTLPWTDAGRATAGYIVYLRELWPGGPALLSLFGMSGPITYGFASAVQEIWHEQFGDDVLDGLEFEESELIFVEIQSRSNHLVPQTETPGYPNYWRTWDLAWNRRGRLVDWPTRCPVRRERGSQG